MHKADKVNRLHRAHLPALRNSCVIKGMDIQCLLNRIFHCQIMSLMLYSLSHKAQITDFLDFLHEYH